MDHCGRLNISCAVEITDTSKHILPRLNVKGHSYWDAVDKAPMLIEFLLRPI